MYTTAFDELMNLERGIEEMFNFVPGTVGHTMPASAPTLNVVEDKEQYQILVELPGVPKDEVRISLHNNLLTINGERKRNALPEGATIIRNESWNGQFQRSVELPEKVDSDGIAAELKDGILTLAIPKAQEVKPREISIR